MAPARKCVRFYADSVHHFAFSLNPDYRYEQGRYGDVVVHVLYQPGDSATWGNGVAVRRTEMALAWLDTLYGKFPWPQITNVHRIEGGGTEFPMMVMDGSAGLGLIVHEVGHNYTMGVLANNEWREGWLDEGFTSFQTGWFFESQGGGQGPAYPGVERNILFWDLERWSEPVSMVSERYRDFTTYNTMIYSKAQLFYEQLRYVVGDEMMRRILRAYYARWKLKHVDESAFRDVAEAVSGMDLKWLFGQWLHGTPLIDYRMKGVRRTRMADGRWLTAVTIERLGDGWMPVEIGDRDTIYARATGQPEVERVEFTTARKPRRLMLDPRVRAHDWNMLNNYEGRGLWGRGGSGKAELRLDDPTRETARRDRIVSAVLPVAWSNDYGGLTLALRGRDNYLGRYNRTFSLLSVGLGDGATHRVGGYMRFANPVRHPMPRTESSVAAWQVEGRTGVALSVDRSLRRHVSYGPDPHAGFDFLWMATTDLGYLDRRLWDDAGTIEAGPWIGTTLDRGNTVWQGRLGVRSGVVYRFPGPGIVATNRYDLEPFARATGEVSARTAFWLKATLGVRVFGGGYLGDNPPPLQRRIPIAGADPYETFTNPLLRSRGAPFVRRDFHYHAPGNANLRAFRSDLGGRWAVGVNVEATKPLLAPPPPPRRPGLLSGVAFAAFLDLGVVDTLAVPSSPAGKWYTTLYDGGVGVVTRHRIRDLDWSFRLEFPLIVNRSNYAADWSGTNEGRLAFRWQISLESSF